MTLSINDDLATRELSGGELETVAAGFGFFDLIKKDVTSIVNELQLTMGYRYHPPLPGGGPGPKGGPYRV